MTSSFPRLALASLTFFLLSGFVMTYCADAAGRGGGAGGGGGGRAGGGVAQTGGGARQSAQIDNSRADARTNNVRDTSVNNVNVERSVNANVDCSGRCGGWDHPVAAAVVVGRAVAAAVGTTVATVPAECVPVSYAYEVYQRCGDTWYLPQGSQFVVVNPPY
jgi:hypothetical protein